MVLGVTQSNFVGQKWSQFHIWFIIYYKMGQMLLQNATITYYNMRQKIVTKCVRLLITKDDTFITSCESYCRMRQFYYKMRQLLQNDLLITKCVGTGAK